MSLAIIICLFILLSFDPEFHDIRKCFEKSSYNKILTLTHCPQIYLGAEYFFHGMPIHISQCSLGTSLRLTDRARFLFLLIIFYWLCYYSFPNFPPLCPLQHAPPTLQHPPLSSCPWVVHISSLNSLFPIPFLTSPHLFNAYQFHSQLWVSDSPYICPACMASPWILTSLVVLVDFFL